MSGFEVGFCLGDLLMLIKCETSWSGFGVLVWFSIWKMGLVLKEAWECDAGES